MKKLLTALIISLLFLGCKKTNELSAEARMLNTLGLSFNKQYTYKNYVAYQTPSGALPKYDFTGETGQITFLEPNRIQEVCQGKTTTSTFVMSNILPYQCSFICEGWGKTENSKFINSIGGDFLKYENTASIFRGEILDPIKIDYKTTIEP